MHRDAARERRRRARRPRPSASRVRQPPTRPPAADDLPCAFGAPISLLDFQKFPENPTTSLSSLAGRASNAAETARERSLPPAKNGPVQRASRNTGSSTVASPFPSPQKHRAAPARGHCADTGRTISASFSVVRSRCLGPAMTALNVWYYSCCHPTARDRAALRGSRPPRPQLVSSSCISLLASSVALSPVPLSRHRVHAPGFSVRRIP